MSDVQWHPAALQGACVSLAGSHSLPQLPNQAEVLHSSHCKVPDCGHGRILCSSKGLHL